MIREDELAQAHIDAMFSLMEFVTQRCPRQCDTEMELRFDELQQSFDRLFPPNKSLAGPSDPQDVLYRDSLGRNYQAAVCSSLMQFANQVSRESESSTIDRSRIKHAVDKLWHDIDRLHKTFFGEPLEEVVRTLP